MCTKLVARNVDQVISGGQLEVQTGGSLDRLDEAHFIFNLPLLQQLLAKIITAGSIAQIFGPFYDGIDQYGSRVRVSRITKTVLERQQGRWVLR